jgi:hypothetical protein
MRKAIRNSLIFLMLAAFLTASCGVSFYVHECRSSQTRDVFAFPEIFNQRSSCGCEEVATGPAPDPFISFHEQDCCKTSHVYLKAKISGLPVFSQAEGKLLFTAAQVDLPGLTLVNEKSPQIKEVISFYHPPPLYGKELIHFLHQIKIPLSFS